MNKELSLEGFRMPGEWESQKSVWIIWPYNKKDWPGLFDNIPEVVSKIISYLSINQNVNLLIRNHKDGIKIKMILKKFKHKISNIKFHLIPTNRIWVRDSGPIFLINDKTNSKIILNFRFNGWAKNKNLSPRLRKLKKSLLIKSPFQKKPTQSKTA